MNEKWFAPASWGKGLLDETLTRIVIKIISEQMQYKGIIKLKTNLTDDLGADSLDVVELVMEMEDQFNIEIPTDFTPKLVGDIIKIVEEKTNAG